MKKKYGVVREGCQRQARCTATMYIILDVQVFIYELSTWKLHKIWSRNYTTISALGWLPIAEHLLKKGYTSINVQMYKWPNSFVSSQYVQAKRSNSRSSHKIYLDTPKFQTCTGLRTFKHIKVRNYGTNSIKRQS